VPKTYTRSITGFFSLLRTKHLQWFAVAIRVYKSQTLHALLRNKPLSSRWSTNCNEIIFHLSFFFFFL